MTTQRASLTAQQAITLAGAYADLVFGTSTPGFTADIAAAFLREQSRQHTAANKARATIRSCFGDPVLDALEAFTRLADQVRVKPAPKATSGLELCAHTSPAGDDPHDMEFLCDAARGHRDWHAAHLPSGLTYAWQPDTTPASTVVHHHDIEAHAASSNEGYDEAARQFTATASVEPVDDIRNFARCGHYLDEARCTRRIHDGDHEVVQDNEVIVWPAGEPDPEPAEEETKAHCMCVTPDWYHDGLDSDISGRLCRRCRLRQSVPYRDLASSPVVPAPTETGPWPTLNAVPTSVRVVKDRLNRLWERRTDTTWKGCDEGPRAGCDAGHPGSGPYTPVEDGEA